MKLGKKMLEQIQVNESVIITDSGGGHVKGAGDVSSKFGVMRPKRFTTRIMFLVDTKELTTTRCVKITRVE